MSHGRLAGGVPTTLITTTRALAASAPIPRRKCGMTSTTTPVYDKLGRRRSPATLPGFRKGQPNCNKGKRLRPETLTPDEVDQLVTSQNRRSASGLRHRALIIFLVRSGLRIAEALALQVGDLAFNDDDSFVVHVRRGKGDKARLVAVDAYATEFLRPWLQRRGTLPGVDADAGFVFCVTDGPTRGGELGSAHVRTMLKRAAKHAGIKKRVAPHMCRHTFACEMFEEGVDLRVIQKSLGHGSLAVTDRYLSHLSPKALLEAAQGRPRPIVQREIESAPARTPEQQWALDQASPLLAALQSVQTAMEGSDT